MTRRSYAEVLLRLDRALAPQKPPVCSVKCPMAQ